MRPRLPLPGLIVIVTILLVAVWHFRQLPPPSESVSASVADADATNELPSPSAPVDTMGSVTFPADALDALGSVANRAQPRDPTEAREAWAERLQASRVVATHTFPADDEGVSRHIAWFETGLKHPLVRLEQSWAPSDAPGGSGLKLVGEHAMTASRLLVGIQPGTTPAAALAALRAEGFAATELPLAPWTLEVVVPEPTAANAYDDTRRALLASPYHVAFAEPDYLITLDSVPVDPRYLAQWGLRSSGEDAGAAIDAEAGWLIRSEAADIVVAITDTGIRPTHEDLAPNLWVNPGELAGNGQDDEGNGVIDDLHGFNAIDGSGDVADDNGHGTHVAGIVGARGNNSLGISGVAWDVQLMTAKFLNHLGIGTTGDAIAAINYARLNGAHIINASWSMNAPSASLEHAIRQAGEAGIVVVAAAGNQSTDLDAMPRYPAAFDLPNIVAVAATGRDRALTSFSNYGRDRVHLAAPGEGILSTYHEADDHYVVLSGTSMAAPYVAGSLALLKAVHPSEDAGHLVNRLVSGVRVAPALADRLRTAGILHLPALLATTVSSPVNDLRATPYVFGDYQGVWSGTTAHATRSPDDPVSLTGDRTLWFSWTAPVDGHSAWRLDEAQPETAFAMYESVNGQLILLQEASAASRTTRFWAEAGREYLIGVGTASVAGHAVTISFSHPPVNDQMADAAVVAGDTFSVTGNNRGATRETGEPRHAKVGAGRSLWWQWTAPRTTEQVFTTQGSAFDTVLAAYRTDPDGGLVEVASNDDATHLTLHSAFSFPAEEGVTYLIAVDSWGRTSGDIRLGGYGLGNILILDQPRSSAVRLGSNVSLRVNFLSSTAARVRWFKDGEPIGGGHDGTLIIGNVGPADFGEYHALIGNEQESLVTASAFLSERVSAPFITWSNGNLNEVVGNPLTLRVEAVGSAPFTFQWFKDGEAIPDSDAASLYFNALTAADAGRYHVVITNASGTTQTTPFNVRVSTSPLAGWSWVTAPDQGWPIHDLRYFGDTYHAVSSSGISTKLLRSTDGVVWREQLLPPAFGARQIAAGNGVTILAGINPSLFSTANGSIFRSTNGGETWTLLGVPFNGSVSSLHFGNGFFVLINNSDGTVRRSTHGTSWAAPVAPPPTNISRLTFVGTRFFAYRHDFGPALHVSADGNTWTTVNVPATQPVEAILHRDGLYHLWANGYFQSPDGLTWTRVGGSSSEASLIVDDGERFVRAHRTQLRLHTSPDGQNWTEHIIPTSGSSRVATTALLHAGGRTVMGCANGLILAGPEIEEFENTATLFTWEGPVSTSRIEFCEDEFIITGRGVSDRVAISSDGATWKAYTIPQITGLNRGRIWKAGGWYWANSSNGDGFWRGRSPLSLARLAGSPSGQINSIVHHAGRFLAVAGSALVTSTDGNVWTPLAPGFSVPAASTLHRAGGRVFLISSRIASSLDGLVWSLAATLNPVSHGFLGFAENNGKFYAVTDSYSQLWESTNGTTWTSRTLPFSTTAMTAFFAYNGSLLCLPSDYGSGDRLARTTNLQTWETINTGVSARYFATGNGIVVGMGSAAHVVYNGRTPSAAPLCRIVSPQADSAFPFNNLVEVRVEASVPDGTFDRVELYIDEALVATSSTPGTLRHTFLASESRTYQFHARAYNTDGIVTGDAVQANAAHAAAAPLTSGAPSAVGQLISLGGTYYATFNGELHRSEDGVRWEFIDLPRFGQSGPTSLFANDGDTPLAIGQSGGLIVTRNGIDWTRVAMRSDTYGPLLYRSGVYFRSYTTSAAGWGGVAVSADAYEWRTLPPRSATYFTTVLMGEGPRFVGWSKTYNPHVRVSSDGLNWTVVPELPVPRSGVEAFGRFILLGLDNQIRTSINGLSWSETALPASVSATRLLHVGDRVFAANDTHLLAVCGDDMVWTPLAPGLIFSTLVHGQGRYVAISQHTRRVSPDGISWTSMDAPWNEFGTTFHLAHGDAGFVMIRGDGLTWRSLDGTDWTEVTRPAGAGGGNWENFVAIGDTWLVRRSTSTPNSPLQRSTDGGSNWSFTPAPFSYTSSARSIKASDDTFFLLEQNSFAGLYKLHRSSDAATWTELPVRVDGVAVPPHFILPLADAWWLLAYDNAVYRSTDQGATWTRHVIDADPAIQLIDLHWSGTGFLAFAYTQNAMPPKLYASTDGLVWSPATPPSGITSLAPRAAGGGRFVMANTGQIFVSADGSNWTVGTGSPWLPPILTYAGDAFFALGSGVLSRSVDGSVWTTVRSGLPSWATQLVELNGVLYAHGAQQLLPLLFTDVALHAVELVGAGPFGIGDTLGLELTVANLGEARLPKLEVALYLSRDSFHGNGDDLPIGLVTVPADQLPPVGESRVLQLATLLPPSLEGGTFHLGAHLDPRRVIAEVNKSNNRRFTSAAQVTVPEWSLDLQTNGEGGIEQSVSAVRYVHGSSLSLSPSAGKNAAFAGWSGSETSERPDLTLTMDGDKTLVAHFAATRQLSVNVVGAGSVQLDRADGRYAQGASAALLALPAPGWRFVGWEEDLDGDQASKALTMTSDRAVVARFDYPIENWRAAHFSVAELAAPAISGDLATPGSNGVPNLLAYLAGRDPRAAAPLGDGPELRAEALYYRFTRNTGAVGARLVAEVSTDLVEWTPAPAERVLGVEDGVETVEVIVPRTDERVFIRLRSE